MTLQTEILIGCIVGQSIVLFWAGYWLLRCRRLIDRQNMALIDASRTMEMQQSLIREITDGGEIRRVNDVGEIPPEVRADMRYALTEMLQQLRKKEH